VLARLAASRLAWGVLVVWLTSVAVFAATQLLPGDAAVAILGRDATPQRLEAIREQLHLGGSPLQQYWVWISGALHLNLGTSVSNETAVSAYLATRFVNTMVLMVLAVIISLPISLLVGAYVAYRKDGPADNVLSVITLAFAALPEFVIGTILIIVFSTGFLTVLPATSSQQPVLAYPEQLILPSLTLALAIAPYIIRMMRATMIEVFESEYVQYARLIGMGEWNLIFRHAAPNAIGTVAQVTALQLAYLAGGVVVVEYVFGFPGLGSALVDAVNNRDLPVLQAICLFIAVFYVVVNLAADVVTLAANPRARRPRS
jgi:peptide/nickel transport system permease protein